MAKGGPGGYVDLGLAVELHQQGKLLRAEKEYRRYLDVRPDDPQALMSFGVLRAQQGQAQAAVALLQKAVALAPDLAAGHYNLGRLLLEQAQWSAAADHLQRAVKLAPGRADTHNNLANALRGGGRWDEAATEYEAALSLDPTFADAAFNLGLLRIDQQRTKDAVEALLIAARARPEDAKINFRLGSLLQFNGQLAEARRVFEHILAANPDHPTALCGLATVKRQTTDWLGLDAIEKRVAALAGAKPDADGNSVDPFTLSIIADDPALMLGCARIAARKKAQGSKEHRIIPRAAEKIRLAYVGGDYREHATSYLIADLIESHDRTKFEVVGVSIGPDDGSPMRRRMEKAFDTFIDAQSLPAAATAARLREAGIDIAIDLVGYNQYERMELYAHRAAPVQVGYLGWPGTTGGRFMDYIIADPVVIPDEARADFAEAVVQLAGCYQANDRHRRPAEPALSRAAFGLPEGAFVFSCFNNTAKISPETFSSWCRILARVPGSVLWLLDDNPAVAGNIRREAETRGIAGERIVLSPRLPMPEHLARHVHADLVLDTLPYNAHTTASDALWMGVPVLTCIGRAFQARVAASLLRAVELPELVTGDRAAFEDLAVALAGDKARLARLKQHLAARHERLPLYDTDRLRREIEWAYGEMWSRCRSGRGAQPITVPTGV